MVHHKGLIKSYQCTEANQLVEYLCNTAMISNGGGNEGMGCLEEATK